MLKSTDPPALSWREILVNDRWDPASRGQLLPSGDFAECAAKAVESGSIMLGDLTWMLAMGLPLRRAIWWACMCVEHARSGAMTTEEEQALSAATAWVIEPSQGRRIVAEFAGRLGKTSPFLCAAAAGFVGSLESDNSKLLEPQTAAGLVQSACIFAIEESKDLASAVSQRQTVLLGMRIARGTFDWSTSAPA